MRVQLRDLTPGTAYGLKFRSNTGTQVSEWSQIQRFTTTNDTIASAPVANLIWLQSGSSFIATWDRPTKDANNNPLVDFRDFELSIDDTVNSTAYIVHTVDNTYSLSEDEQVKAFGSRKTALRLTVTVRDINYNVSTPVTVTSTASPPPVPSKPTVSLSLGMLKVTWDTKDFNGLGMPENFSHVEVHVSATSGFTPDSTTFKEILTNNGSSASALIPGLTYDVLQYVRLVSVSKLDKKSGPSVQASGTQTRLSGLDIGNNQISTAQINFTAFDIGGANAYYPATTAARDALTGVKNGDIAYITGSGYATYRYNGAAWVSAPEIGTVSGSKIIAGTVTANAIGTNQIIASSANLGTAVVDSANISSVNAAKITAGLLQSSNMVTYGGGTSRPAWSFDLNGSGQLSDLNVRGQLVIGNSGDTTAVQAASVVRSFDYIANTAGWAIKGDGTVEFNNGTFRGNIAGGTITGATYQTATIGRRIVINTTAATGEIKLISPTNITASIRTQAFGGGELLSMGFPIAGADPVWNSYTATSSQLIMYSPSVNSYFGGTATGGGSFNIVWVGDTPAPGGTFNTLRTRFTVDRNNYQGYYGTSGSFKVFNDNSVQRISIDDTYGTVISSPAPGNTRLWVSDDPNPGMAYYATTGGQRIRWADTVSYMWHGPQATTGWLEWGPGGISPAGTYSSNYMLFATPESPSHLIFAGALKYARYATSNPQGPNPGIEVLNADQSGFDAIKASAFVVSSSETVKENIQNLGPGAMEKLRPIKVRKFHRKGAEPGVQEIGIIAEDMPPEIVLHAGKYGPMVSLSGYVAMQHAALQEVDERLDKQEKLYATINERLTNLENIIKNMEKKK